MHREHPIDAEAPPRLGVLEFPALAAPSPSENDVAVTYG